MTPVHLTEDEIDDLLIGQPATGSMDHVESCRDCAARLTAARQPLVSFNAVSLAWGQRRSATLPLQLPQKPASLFTGGRLRLASGALGTAVAAVFALALALPRLHHGSAPQTAQQAIPQPVPEQTTAVVAHGTAATAASVQSETPEDQIARDNRLLQAIDRELATSETPADLLKMAGQQDANQSSPDTAHND
jgi:hypothetical protein